MVTMIPQCPYCGNLLTTDKKFDGLRCLDPGHWEAAGLEPPPDLIPPSLVLSWAKGKLDRQMSGAPDDGEDDDYPF